MIEQWPDEKLERCMIEDADLILSEYPDLETSAIHDAACHIKALLARVRELEAERQAFIKPVIAKFSPDREVSRNERHLLNLLSWRENEAKQLKEELAVVKEQLEVAIDRSQSWKNLAEKYQEAAEAKQEGLDRQRQQRKWLLRCEAAIKSMAAQFLCPKTTPEEMVDQILKGDKQ